MRRLFLVSLVGLASCKSFAAKVQPPPVYNEECKPTPAYWEGYARETADLAPEGYIPENPDEAYQKALDEVDRLGLRLVGKNEGVHAQWDGFSTTFPDTILLAADWDDKSIQSKAEILWHELVHKRQWDRLGREVFIARYSVAAGRWGLEVPAYRESFRVEKLFGVPEDKIRENMERRAESLFVSYALGGSMPECTKQTSVEIWSTEL